MWVSWSHGFVRDFVFSLGLSQVHYRNSYRVKGEEQFMG